MTKTNDNKAARYYTFWGRTVEGVVIKREVAAKNMAQAVARFALEKDRPATMCWSVRCGPMDSPNGRTSYPVTYERWGHAFHGVGA